MAERLTIRLDDGVRSRLFNVAKARRMDISSVVRQAVMADLDGVSGPTPTTPPPT